MNAGKPRRGIPLDIIGEYVKEMLLDPEGHRGVGTLKDMLTALEAVGLSRYYGDVHKVCERYWGWKLHNISHLETQIIEDCCKIKPIFDENKGERKSNLGYWYTLWRCLDRLNYGVSPDDFKIASTPKIIDFYERMWNIFCKVLGWGIHDSIGRKRIYYLSLRKQRRK